MKVALISDVHLEFGDCFFENTENAEVLILGGDILIAQDLHDFKNMGELSLYQKVLGKRYEAAVRYREFLQRCSEQFNNVIYIAGNHEFYHGKFPIGLDYLREECANYKNINFLENSLVNINETCFIGCTLWTDMNNNDPITINFVQKNMNDFLVVRHNEQEYRKFKPMDTVITHRSSVNYIKQVIQNEPNKSYVVIGHHAPSKKSTKPKYEKDFHMNGAYSSDLSNFILDNPQIKVWTHGHTHDPFDYMIGTTRILCNPRGYVGLEVDDEKGNLVYFDV